MLHIDKKDITKGIKGGVFSVIKYPFFPWNDETVHQFQIKGNTEGLDKSILYELAHKNWEKAEEDNILQILRKEDKRAEKQEKEEEKAIDTIPKMEIVQEVEKEDNSYKINLEDDKNDIITQEKEEKKEEKEENTTSENVPKGFEVLGTYVRKRSIYEFRRGTDGKVKCFSVKKHRYIGSKAGVKLYNEFLSSKVNNNNNE